VRSGQEQVAATKVSVSKHRYGWYRTVGVGGLAVAVAAGVFAWQSGSQNSLQASVIASQARFLANDYSGALAELDARATTSLPASAKYVLAVSSVNLYDLTATQKQSVLNTISEKSDDVTLNYWIEMGRGDFEQALDYAQNLGDDQLALLAYTDLYQATKLDDRMAGGKKQELLSEYTKAIDELTAKLEGTDETAAEG
jgi:type VII secretion protein EssB